MHSAIQIVTALRRSVRNCNSKSKSPRKILGDYLFHQKLPDQAETVQHRLVQQIYQQGIPADPVQHRYTPPTEKPFVQVSCRQTPVEEIPRHEQEKPGEQAEIIRGPEARIGKPQIGRQVIPVEPFGQLPEDQRFKAQRSLAAVAQQKEQRKADNQAGNCRNPLKGLLKQDHQQHTAADAGQNSEENPVFGHQNIGNQRNDHTAAKDQRTTAQMIPAQLPAEARQQDEGPADALLPDVFCGPRIPPGVDAEEVYQIPHAVIGDHIDHQKTPEGIQKMKSVCFPNTHENSLQHDHQQRHDDDDADDDGQRIDGAAQSHIALQLGGEAGHSGADGGKCQDHQRLPHLKGKGKQEIETEGQNHGNAVAYNQDPGDDTDLGKVHIGLKTHADHQHGQKHIGARNDSGTIHHKSGKADVQQIHCNRENMRQKGNGHCQRLQHPLRVKAFAVFHGRGHAVGTAEADEGIAHVEQGRSQHAHGAKKALGEGQGKGANVVAGDVQNFKGLLLLIPFPVQKEAEKHIDHAAAKAQQYDGQHTQVNFPAHGAGNQGGRQRHLNHQLGDYRKGVFVKEPDPPQHEAQYDDRNIAARFH